MSHYTDGQRYRAFRWVALAADDDPIVHALPAPDAKLGEVDCAQFDAAVDALVEYLLDHGVIF